MTKIKSIIYWIISFLVLGVAFLYATWPSFDRLPIKVQPALWTGSNHSMVSFVEYGADYMRDVASSTETGNYLAGKYHDSMFGFFTFDWSSFIADNVRVGSTVSDCATGTGYKMTGNAYSEIFGFVDFDYNNDIYVYYCPFDKSLYGHAYGEWTGFQNFTGIELETGPVPEVGGLKVLGQSHNVQFNEIRAGQNESDLHILWGIDKSLQLRNIKKRILSFARNIPDAGAGLKQIRDVSDFNDSSNRGGKVFENGNVIYFKGNAGDFVTLGDGAVGSTLTVHWRKTIIVVGVDIYIKSNITYDDKDSDILGIIILEDSDGRGGNIVVHPGVTNLAWTLVAERVLLSGVEYGGSLEIHDGTTDEALLANQLHIFGNLLSENTIGGSVATNPQCPYYIEQRDCTTANQAQSFDLNFLRRFRMDIYGNPAHGGMVAGGGTCSGWNCTGWDPALMKNILSTSDPLADYPLIIEYNPKIQLMPPPLLKSQ